MITGKTIALTLWTFVGKVVSLLFNMLSRFVIAFLEIEATATIFKHRLSFREGCLLSMLISHFPLETHIYTNKLCIYTHIYS